MKSKLNDAKYLASFISENVEKDSIISEVFELFKIDCLERCSFNPSEFDGMIKEFNEKSECDVQLLEKIISFIKNGQENTKKRQDELCVSIVKKIEETLTLDTTMEDISKELHISYYYMCHLFKDRYGMSPNTYKNRQRITLAMKMLVADDKKITDIATETGFNSIGYFAEVFTKLVGMTPSVFRESNRYRKFHDFYSFDDIMFALQTECLTLTDENLKLIKPEVSEVCVYRPDDNFKFLHESAIIEYKGVLYASWYLCPKYELNGYTPICGKRSYDKGKTWTELEILCSDESEKLMYCPPIYGICDGKLYMMVNSMVAPDYMHSLELYVLDEESDKFVQVWSKPICFKLNTNVVKLSNGKLLLPGRLGELDGFPTTPAVMISDSGKIDGEWRIVKIAPDGNLPLSKRYIYPELTVIEAQGRLYMFCRNDTVKVPVVYTSDDMGESWSKLISHDIPYVSSKIYCLTLSDGCHCMICNIDRFNRSRLALYITDGKELKFTKYALLFDNTQTSWGTMHYPAAYEYDGYLYVIATKGYENSERGASLMKIRIEDLR